MARISPLLSSHLCLKVTLFLSHYRKFHMNWTSFKRWPVLKNHFSMSQMWPLNGGLTALLRVPLHIKNLQYPINYPSTFYEMYSLVSLAHVLRSTANIFCNQMWEFTPSSYFHWKIYNIPSHYYLIVTYMHGLYTRIYWTANNYEVILADTRYCAL